MKSLNIIDSMLTNAQINYEFGTWNSDIIYPYFVGEYQETEPTAEDGRIQIDFILNGFSRESWSELITTRTTIENLFSSYTTVLADGTGISISYAGALIVPTGDAELKRIQINLSILEWRVIE